MLAIFCVSLLITGGLNSLSSHSEETTASTIHEEKNITESVETPIDNYGSPLLIAGIIMSVVGVIMAVQILSWAVYYMKTKENYTNEILVDFDEESS